MENGNIMEKRLTREIRQDTNKDWVEFDGELYPSYDTDKGGYRFRVTYRGVDYYFS